MDQETTGITMFNKYKDISDKIEILKLQSETRRLGIISLESQVFTLKDQLSHLMKHLELEFVNPDEITIRKIQKDLRAIKGCQE